MYVIGTAGHVDHGKSRLVEALTGIDPDRLEEEKRRGMTIDLGFAWLTLPSGRTASIVDVPGHERFIKNMLAGAGGIDVALLVVAADDGVMPQTREHLAILHLLGVQRGVIALTKCDLVDADWIDIVEADVRELLAPTALAGSPLVRCSSVTGLGLGELRAALDTTIDSVQPKRNRGRPRLPVDRVFTMAGFGTVVTGTLMDGALRIGDEVELLPGGLRARVRGLQSHKEKLTCALPGMRAAVNLAGVAKADVRRGTVLAFPGSCAATSVFDAQVTVLPAAPRPLPHNARLTLHVFTAEAPAQLRLLDRDELLPGETAWAQLRLSEPVVVARGDHFVLRTPDDTAGGGIVARIDAPRHRRRDRAVLAGLERLLGDSAMDHVAAALSDASTRSVDELAVITSLPRDEVRQLADALVASGAARWLAAGERLVDVGALAGARERAQSALTAFHTRHPLRPGMPREELRAATRLDARAFDDVMPLVSEVVLEGGVARLADFTPRPTTVQRAAADAWLRALRAGTPPPPIDDELRAYLVRNGEAVDAGGGVVFEAAHFAEMRALVLERLRGRGAITVAEARDLLGTNRRRAQALLELMDRLGDTRRAGDAHVARDR